MQKNIVLGGNMTREQKEELLSLIREYGDTEVSWARKHRDYIWSPEVNPPLPDNQPVINAFEKVVTFIHSL